MNVYNGDWYTRRGYGDYIPQKVATIEEFHSTLGSLYGRRDPNLIPVSEWVECPWAELDTPIFKRYIVMYEFIAMNIAFFFHPRFPREFAMTMISEMNQKINSPTAFEFVSFEATTRYKQIASILMDLIEMVQNPNNNV